MKRKWNDPDHEPTPEQLAAWADGELPWPEARQIEAWLARHPDQARDAEGLRQLVRLYRDNAPSEPPAQVWQTALDQIESALEAPRPPSRSPSRSWRLHLLLGLIGTAAAVLGAVLLARNLGPTPKPPVEPESIASAPEEDEVFPVVSVSEIHIISVDTRDADRIALDQPLMGSFELAADEDITIEKVERNPDEETMPRLKRRAGVPMIIVVRADDEDEDP
jgi:hypothetical protein